mmetsp:Transcript_59992/g.193135  ORF Transcript_59992/g.193135 Transcript_59992/m.193135 type:complete len:236 (+) Transcript_59992:288-995(+)
MLQILMFQHGLELLQRDLPVTIPVEGPEGVPARVLVGVEALVQRGGQELAVVHLAPALEVHAVHDLPQVLGQGQLCSDQSVVHLADGDRAAAVGVDAREGLREVPDLRLVHLARDGHQRRLLELAVPPEALEVLYDVETQRRARGPRREVLDPLVLQHLGSCGPRARIQLQQAADEVLRVLGDVLPGRAVHGVPPGAHRRKHGVIRPAAEGRLATQDAVGNDPATPQVAGGAVRL